LVEAWSEAAPAKTTPALGARITHEEREEAQPDNRPHSQPS